MLLVPAIVCSWLVVRMRRHAPISVSGVVTLVDTFTMELPTGSTLHFSQGIDSLCGELRLGGLNRTLEFDIGNLAGNYSLNECNGPFKWQKHMKSEGTQIDYALKRNKHNKQILLVSFPSLGPANFWAPVANDDEMEAILRVMRTVRAKPLPRRQSKKLTGLP